MVPSDVIAAARAKAGLSVDQLAQLMEMSSDDVAALEAGTLVRGRRMLAAVLTACGLSDDWRPDET